LNKAGVPAGPVLTMEQVFSDPQVLARAMKVELTHPEVGRFTTTGLPVKLSHTPGAIERRPPLYGEHTREVLLECELTSAEIARLERNGII
jgi:crotonobetainyl-CoA:carnitine CoA-transferase CaiB-like acyl-CoA transferase